MWVLKFESMHGRGVLGHFDVEGDDQNKRLEIQEGDLACGTGNYKQFA